MGDEGVRTNRNMLLRYPERAPQSSTPLPADLEHDLAVRYRAGDRAAGQRLVEGCLSHVTAIARQYRRWGTPMEDLVQQGNIGLLKAADRFDPARGFRLATFAKFWIRAEIRDYVTRNHRVVWLGASKMERRAVRYFRQTRITDPVELSEKTGLPVRYANDLLPILTAHEAALDAPAREDQRALADRLSDGSPSPEDSACAADEAKQLEAALRTVLAELPEREMAIVERRILSDEPETLEQLGATFGVSRERIRQVEERAKARMRGRLGQIAGHLVADRNAAFARAG